VRQKRRTRRSSLSAQSHTPRFRSVPTLRAPPPLRLPLDNGTNIWRVQVKTGSLMVYGLYRVAVRHGTNDGWQPYNASEIDFVAAYILPEDTCYILPVREVVGRQLLNFRPKGYPAARHLGPLPRSLAPPARTRRPSLRMRWKGRVTLAAAVVLRQRSPRQSQGLPTKHLCTPQAPPQTRCALDRPPLLSSGQPLC
jgi:PD-(D/E)XK endonuclease